MQLVIPKQGLSGELWDVTFKSMLSGVTETREYDYVFVCNGHYNTPFIPRIPGLKEFKGESGLSVQKDPGGKRKMCCQQVNASVRCTSKSKFRINAVCCLSSLTQIQNNRIELSYLLIHSTSVSPFPDKSPQPSESISSFRDKPTLACIKRFFNTRKRSCVYFHLAQEWLYYYRYLILRKPHPNPQNTSISKALTHNPTRR